MTNSQLISISDIEVEVVRKRVKHLRLVVSAPDGKVRVSAPPRASDEAVRSLILAKLDWIKKHQARFLAQPRAPELKAVSGETHFVFGEPCLLEVIEWTGRQQVVLLDRQLRLFVKPGANQQQRIRILNNWYRDELKKRVPDLLARWEPVIGQRVAQWGVKNMKTRWGTCNITKRRVWLNLELAKKPPPCLEYIIVHEMVHLLERYHNARFHAFMDQFLPQWRECEELLNRPQN